MIGSQVSTRLYPTLGPRRLMVGGLVGVGIVVGLLSLVGFDTSLWLVRTDMFFLGIAMAHVFAPAQAAAFATISPAATGRASTLFNTARQVGSAIGVAVLTSVISAVGLTHLVNGGVQQNLAAYHWAFLIAAAFALLAAFVANTVVDADAAPTMKPRKAEAPESDRVPALAD
jgi:MFS family permease